MPKKIMQDVTVKKAHRATSKTPHIEDALSKLNREEKMKDREHEESPIFEKMRQHNEGRGTFDEECSTSSKGGFGKFKKSIFAAAILVIIAGIFIYGTVSYSASVNITLQHADISLQDKTFTAVANDPANIPFQIMSLSEEQSANIQATGEKQVNAKATGKITIYNSFGSQPQTLIKNTRFQTSDGRVFRIDQTISVPGRKSVGGKSVPGSVEASVFADVSGVDGNIGPSNFTIPGLKGTPKYSKFSAKSLSNTTGGAQGTVKVVSDDDVLKARTELTAALKQKLATEADAEHPKGTTLFPSAEFYTFTEVLDNSAANTGSNVKFTLKGKLDAVLFDSVALAKQVVLTNGAVSESEKVEINNIGALTFAWQKNMSTAPQSTDTLQFTLNGNAHTVWVIDTELLKNKLTGVKYSEYKKVLSLFPGIEKVTVSILPFWKSSFPTDKTRIHVTTKID